MLRICFVPIGTRWCLWVFINSSLDVYTICSSQLNHQPVSSSAVNEVSSPGFSSSPQPPLRPRGRNFRSLPHGKISKHRHYSPPLRRTTTFRSIGSSQSIRMLQATRIPRPPLAENFAHISPRWTLPHPSLSPMITMLRCCCQI